MEGGKLVILIKRKEKVVIPDGKTTLMEDDILIINQISDV